MAVRDENLFHLDLSCFLIVHRRKRGRSGGLSGPVDILPFNFSCSVYTFVPFWNERRVSNVPWCLCIVEGQKEDCFLVQELRLKTFNVLICV